MQINKSLRWADTSVTRKAQRNKLMADGLIAADLVAKGYTMKAIAKEIGCSRHRVYTALARAVDPLLK